jgi:hypothetical protein
VRFDEYLNRQNTSGIAAIHFLGLAQEHATLRPPFNIRKGDKPSVAGRTSVKRAAWLASLLRESGAEAQARPEGRRGREGLLVQSSAKSEGRLAGLAARTDTKPSVLADCTWPDFGLQFY